MGAYAVLIDAEHARALPDPTEPLRRRLRRAGWCVRHQMAGLALFAPEGSALPWRRVGPGLVIGEVIDTPSLAAASQTLTAQQALMLLIERSFGRYVFVAPRRGVEPAVAFRDPSGGLGGLSVDLVGAHLVADQLPAALLPALGPALEFDWRGVAGWLSDASTLQGHSGLRGVRPLIPGAMRRFGTGGGDVTLWDPCRLAAQPVDSGEVAGVMLAEAVMRATAGLCSGDTPILAEVSGGLDSSIIAAALAATGAPVRAWLNIATDDVRGDERVYARALCDVLGAPLTDRPAQPLHLTPDAIALSQSGSYPSLSGMDDGFEETVIAAARAVGARRVFTGLGGDSVLFAFATPLIIRDLVLRRGVRSLCDPLLEALARWTRTSVWSVARLGALGAQQQDFPTPISAWIGAASASRLHPWLSDASALPPAKRFQLESLVHTQAALGPCRRTAALDLVHPLLSQPVLEACLRIPVDLLVEGGRDRGLARRVFANRLPVQITQRRSKGDVAIRFGTALIESLTEIRAYLLDGRLAAVGLIDPVALEATLRPDALPHGNEALNIMRAIAVEAWVRRWEGTRRNTPQAGGAAGA